MGSSSVEEAKRWLRQRRPVPDRVASLILRCAEGGMKPGKLRMSSDLYVQMIAAARRSMKKEFDPENETLPKAISVALGDHKLMIIHDEALPWASMHITK